MTGDKQALQDKAKSDIFKGIPLSMFFLFSRKTGLGNFKPYMTTARREYEEILKAPSAPNQTRLTGSYNATAGGRWVDECPQVVRRPPGVVAAAEAVVFAECPQAAQRPESRGAEDRGAPMP